MTDKPTGMEMMFRSMGLGQAIDAAKSLAESGAISKIIAFAERLEKFDLEALNERLARIEHRIASGPGTRNEFPGNLGFEPEPGASETDADHRRHNGDGATGKPVDNGFVGDI